MDPKAPSVVAAVRSLILDESLREVLQALDAEGVPSVLLKGPSHAKWLYDDPGERPYVDIDLLVSPSDADRAERVLASLGYHRRGLESMPHDRPHHAVPLRRSGGVAVDLHTTFVGVGVSAAELWHALSSHRETMTIAGREVPILDPTGRTVVLALHSAKDGGRVARVREDIERAVTRLPIDTWRDAQELADRLQATAAFGVGLRRCPAGEALADRLGLATEVTAEMALRTDQAPALAVGLEWLLRSERGDPVLVLRKIFPPPDYLRGWKPLARKGPIGLALAYLWRPFWVAYKAVPAAIAVYRARRGAGHDL